MNAALNRWTAIGNLTQDPSYTEMPKGGYVCNFGMAINETYKSKGGETKEDVLFIDIEVFGQQAVNCRDYLHKGAQIFVDGKIKSRALAAGRGTKYFVRADRVIFLRYRPKGSLEMVATSSEVLEIALSPAPPVEDDIPF